MTQKTRYFVIASLLVLVVGLGTGLVAFFTGLPMGAFSRQGGPDELQLIPRNAALVGYVDVHEIMLSNVRQKVLPLVPTGGAGREEFQARTGINLETDVDYIVAGAVPATDQTQPFGGIMIARGRFEDAKIEALMTEHGAQVETYKGRKLLVAPPQPDGRRQQSISLAFVEPGLVAAGEPALVRGAIDLKDGGDSVITNDDLMTRVRALDNGNAWVVGRFDALGRGRLPSGIALQLPAISWISLSGQIDDGVRGEVRADASDNDAANNLREVVRGFVALAKLQASSRPELRDVVDSLNIGGTGNTVSLSFNLPASVIDTLSAALPRRNSDPSQGR